MEVTDRDVLGRASHGIPFVPKLFDPFRLFVRIFPTVPGNSWGIWGENTGVSMDFCSCLRGCADKEELTAPFSGMTAREGRETKHNVGFGATNGNSLEKGSFQGLPAQLGWG